MIPEDGEFWIPHSLALIEDLNLICVADRENERIQCFSAGLAEGGRAIPPGIFITKAENIGRVYAIREKRWFPAVQPNSLGKSDVAVESDIETFIVI